MATGDIPFMWIRDSAVQWGALLPRMVHQPALRLLVEGAVRTQVSRCPVLPESLPNSKSLGLLQLAGLYDFARPLRQFLFIEVMVCNGVNLWHPEVLW